MGDVPLELLNARAAALDAVPEGICICDRAPRLVYVNPAFSRITGWSPAEVLHTDPRAYVEPTNPAALQELNLQLKAAEPWHGELTLRHAGGHTLLVRVTVSPVHREHRVVLFRDIGAWRRAAEAERRSAETWRLLIETSPDGVVVEREGRVLFTNPAFRQCIGVAELPPGREVRPLLAEESVAAWDRLLAGGDDPHAEVRLRRADGREVEADVKALPIVFDGVSATVLLVRDLSRRRERELRARETDRMVSIGTLAAGIAHEINTPVQFIGDSAWFLGPALADVFAQLSEYREALSVADPVAAARLRDEEEGRDLPYVSEHAPRAVERILDGTRRIGSIVRAMKELGHPGSIDMAATDLNRAIENTLVVTRNEWKYVAEVETNLGELPPVMAHLGSINQVFLNLVVNAAHAIADRVGDSGDRGQIVVRSRAGGGRVYVSVSDTGVGISEAHRARVFDPFFTTKPIGRGTGQGLAIARSIVVEKHRGRIWFESEVGVGTTFHVELPVEAA